MATFDGDGLVIDRLADIKEEMQDELKAVFGDGINLAETSPFGILIGIMSERYFFLWEKLEAVYNASFPETSFGVYLDETAAFNGVVRESATKSTVVLEFTRSNDINDGDVVVPAGTQANATGSSVLWTTLADTTILDTTLTATAAAAPVDYGPIGAVQDSIIVLVSAPANVGAVNNDAAAEIGTLEETDAALKVRRNTELGKVGTATEAGIRGALQLLDIIATASLILNDTDFAVGLQPPHSIAAFIDVVNASTGDEETRDLISQTLWDSKGAGINTYGDLSGTAVDENGDDQTVYFSEITTLPVYVKVFITITSDYDDVNSDAAIAAAIENFSITELVAGTDVLNYKVECAATNVGAEGITQLRTEMSLDDITYASDNIPVGPEEVAFLDSTLVTFVKTGP